VSSEDTILEAASILVDAYRVPEPAIADYNWAFAEAADERSKQVQALQAAVLNIGAMHYEECCGPDCACCETPCDTCTQIRFAVAAVMAVIRSDMDHGLKALTTPARAIGRVRPPEGTYRPVGEDTRRISDPGE
jgi:hypothetical protein